MGVYTVLAPEPKDGGLPPADPMEFVFIKDGFSWPAFFFAALWMIYRRLWLVLIAYIVISVALAAAVSAAGGGVFGFAILALHFLFALEAAQLRAWTLTRHGYRLVGIAEGRREEEAEVRYFSEIEAGSSFVATGPVPPVPPTPPAPAAPPSPRAPIVPRVPQPPGAPEVVGLFPEPGGAPGHSS